MAHTSTGHNKLAVEHMEFVNSVRYRIPLEGDLVSTILQYGMFDYIVTGPGLTADVLGLKDKKAVDGKLYLVFTPEPDNLIQWYEDHPQHAVRTPSTLRDLFVCNDGEYAVGIIYPQHYGEKVVTTTDLCLTNKDCFMKYMKTDIGLGIGADGTYIYKPKALDNTTQLVIDNHPPIIQRFSQIYLKAYIRLGLKPSYDTYSYVWKWICAKNHTYNDVNDVIKLDEWIKALPQEPITFIR